VFHADADLAVAVECTIEAHDVRGVALMQNLQLSDDLVPDCRFYLQVNELGKGTEKKIGFTEGRKERKEGAFLNVSSS
jgi:hypothetical protein